MRITIVPLGPIPEDLLEWLSRELTLVTHWDTLLGGPLSLPGKGYDRRRQQHVGESLVSELRSCAGSETDRLLGLADVDCYSQGLNFIFGQASLGGREAFVALPRLRPSFYGLPDDEELFRQRCLKEAIHELGHTLWLQHCPRPSCVMHFSNSLHDTDVKDHSFCWACMRRLDRALEQTE